MAGKVVPMETRLALMVAGELEAVSVSAVCRELGISRQTYYRLRRRYQQDGPAGLAVRSRRPHRSPRQLDLGTELEIIRLREELPVTRGAAAIVDELRRAGHPVVPSVSTVHRVLVRNQLVVPAPQKRPRASWRRFVYAQPNGCWQIDATWWALAEGTAVAIMNVVDDHSRVLVATLAAAGETVTAASTAITIGGQQWGLPEQVLSDNGSCFGGVDKRGDFPDLLAWLGVRLVHARVYHPQTMGKVERFHQTLKRWLHIQPRARQLTELQSQLDDFAGYYNTRRPHRALHGATPGEVWQASPAAGPADQPLPAAARISIHHPTVDTNGVLAVGRYRIGLGTTWTGHRLTAIRYGAQILVLDHTRPIRAVSITPTQRYYSQSAARPRGLGPALPAPQPARAAKVSRVQGDHRPSRSDAPGAPDPAAAGPDTTRRPNPPTNYPQTHQLSPMT